MEFVRCNPDSNFFFDEVPVGVSGITTHDLKVLALKVSADKYLWIACQSHLLSNKKHLEGTQIFGFYCKPSVFNSNILMLSSNRNAFEKKFLVTLNFYLQMHYIVLKC
jgi:hypothetical protein